MHHRIRRQLTWPNETTKFAAYALVKENPVKDRVAGKMQKANWDLKFRS